MKKLINPKADRWMIAGLIVAAFAVAALSFSATRPVPPEEVVGEEQATLEPVEGTDLSRVTLTEEAIARLGIQTAPVTDMTVAGRKVAAMPYSALLYEPSGDTWAYTKDGPTTFVRRHVVVADITGDKVVLAEGPALGTEVVTVGSSELYGAEVGVGEE